MEFIMGVGRLSIEEAQLINDIQKRLVRVETKLDDFIEDLRSAAEARDIARDGFTSAKNAHKRIDEVADNQRWLWRTMIGGMIAAVITFFIQFKGG